MSFTLPELPYAYDALQPYMPKETLEFHTTSIMRLTSTPATTC